MFLQTTKCSNKRGHENLLKLITQTTPHRYVIPIKTSTVISQKRSILLRLRVFRMNKVSMAHVHTEYVKILPLETLFFLTPIVHHRSFRVSFNINPSHPKNRFSVHLATLQMDVIDYSVLSAEFNTWSVATPFGHFVESNGLVWQSFEWNLNLLFFGASKRWRERSTKINSPTLYAIVFFVSHGGWELCHFDRNGGEKRERERE